MSTSRFAGVSRAARSLLGGSAADALATADTITPAQSAAETPPADPPVPPVDDDDEKDPPMPPTEDNVEASADSPAPSAAADESAKIQAAERARVATVFASEHATGRERQAADMLQTSMSAAEITGLLAKAPKGGAAADPMLASLAGNKNPSLGAGAETETDKSKAADDVWDRARPNLKR